MLPTGEGAPILDPGRPPSPKYPLGVLPSHRFPSQLFERINPDYVARLANPSPNPNPNPNPTPTPTPNPHQALHAAEGVVWSGVAIPAETEQMLSLLTKPPAG